MPAEVTAQDVELPLGVANDRVPHNRVMIVVLLIITSVLIIRPHAGEINERSCGGRTRLSGGDDTDANENSESGSSKHRNAQKKPTAAGSLHRNGAQQTDKKSCNESWRDLRRKALLNAKEGRLQGRQLARAAQPFVCFGFIRGLAGGGKLEEAKSSCFVRAPPHAIYKSYKTKFELNRQQQQQQQ